MATKSAAKKTNKKPAKNPAAKKQAVTKQPSIKPLAKKKAPASKAANKPTEKPPAKSTSNAARKPPAKPAAKPAKQPVAKPATRSKAVKLNLVRKIINAHLVEGQMIQGAEVAIGIDQTLTQDATGTMVYLQLEAMGIKRVQTEISVSYVDHHLLQTGFENADDHRYLQTVAAKYGIHFSRPGNGICHQVHLERFAAPGKTVLGCDSNTSMLGALGCFALGGGGMDVALAMCGEPLHLIMPQVVNVVVKGQLSRWASAKDVILELLRRLTIRGGAKRVFEYSGDGLKNLTLAERATIANMGAELGATSSIFPSDAITQTYLRSQKRTNVYRALAADKNCQYDEQIELNLRKIEPLIAQPSSPDNVVPVKKLKNVPVDQVIIGSTSNGAFEDLALAAEILKKSHPPRETGVSVVPASRQVLHNLAQTGHLEQLIQSGVRILECSHGPGAGLGQAPASNAVSLRTFNRNYGAGDNTNNAKVYLCSPATAAASALKGKLTDPRTLKRTIRVNAPKTYQVDDAMIVTPPKSGNKVEVVRGPNIKKLPTNDPLADDLAGEVLLRMGENVATNHMLPSGPRVQLLRSNIPAISRHLFETIDSSFSRRAKEAGGGFLVADENYGQGPSHEHAALAAMYLGVMAVLAKSFARIHRSNLINYGIIPLTFVDPNNYSDIDRGDRMEIPFAKHMLTQGKPLVVKNLTKHKDYNMEHGLSPRQCEIILAGGLLNFIRQSQ